MALIDTDQIAKQFGQQAAAVISEIAVNGLQLEKDTLSLLKQNDLVITIQLKDRA